MIQAPSSGADQTANKANDDGEDYDQYHYPRDNGASASAKPFPPPVDWIILVRLHHRAQRLWDNGLS